MCMLHTLMGTQNGMHRQKSKRNIDPIQTTISLSTGLNTHLFTSSPSWAIINTPGITKSINITNPFRHANKPDSLHRCSTRPVLWSRVNKEVIKLIDRETRQRRMRSALFVRVDVQVAETADGLTWGWYLHFCAGWRGGVYGLRGTRWESTILWSSKYLLIIHFIIYWFCLDSRWTRLVRGGGLRLFLDLFGI
jgi:hypothetical protein